MTRWLASFIIQRWWRNDNKNSRDLFVQWSRFLLTVANWWLDSKKASAWFARLFYSKTSHSFQTMLWRAYRSFPKPNSHEIGVLTSWTFLCRIVMLSFLLIALPLTDLGWGGGRAPCGLSEFWLCWVCLLLPWLLHFEQDFRHTGFCSFGQLVVTSQ